jgi:hypothetical protein
MSQHCKVSASMPMKCIDQMPVPMAIPPPTNQAVAATPLDAVIRDARLSAVYEASDATKTETRTSQ